MSHKLIVEFASEEDMDYFQSDIAKPISLFSVVRRATIKPDDSGEALQENKDAAYRIITRLQKDNVELFHTLQSATAWVRAAGGDCITLDEIISRLKPANQDNLQARSALTNHAGKGAKTVTIDDIIADRPPTGKGEV